MKFLFVAIVCLAVAHTATGFKLKLPQVFSRIFGQENNTPNAYKAVVVESSVFNLKHKFWSIINSDEYKDADIIVFPEQCLNDVATAITIADSHDTILPCHDMNVDLMLRSVSCAARKASTYVVINVMVKEACSAKYKCRGDDQLVVFNTAVVFDRQGFVIAR